MLLVNMKCETPNYDVVSIDRSLHVNKGDLPICLGLGLRGCV
jgi:hypothetical protein